LFRETPLETLERLALGAAWALKPPRHKMLPALARLWLTDLMAPDHALPDPEADLADGLAGIVHDLSVPTLLGAYERGLYPFAHAGPLKWWSAPDRSVLFFDEFHFSNNQRRLMRQGRYTVTFDRDFENVITACAGRRSGRWHLTWITPRIMHAYAEAFDAGHAHSFEVWNEKGELAGGGYGLSVGAAFFAESQFSREPNTGKIGMAVLNWHLAKWGYHFNDGKLIGRCGKAWAFAKSRARSSSPAPARQHGHPARAADGWSRPT
jgi:leucyl/phenylalanyl-tRNA--protein transferase